MILEAAAALVLTTATSQSPIVDLAEMQRRVESWRAAADRPSPPPGQAILHTPADFQQAARRALLDRLRDPALLASEMCGGCLRRTGESFAERLTPGTASVA